MTSEPVNSGPVEDSGPVKDSGLTSIRTSVEAKEGLEETGPLTEGGVSTVSVLVCEVFCPLEVTSPEDVPRPLHDPTHDSPLFSTGRDFGERNWTRETRPRQKERTSPGVRATHNASRTTFRRAEGAAATGTPPF